MLQTVSINDQMYDLDVLEAKYPSVSYKKITQIIKVEQMLEKILKVFKTPLVPSLPIHRFGLYSLPVCCWGV